MNHFLRKCVEEFEQVSTEIGLLPALLYTTLIILMTVVGIVFVLILGIMALVLSPFVHHPNTIDKLRATLVIPYRSTTRPYAPRLARRS